MKIKIIIGCLLGCFLMAFLLTYSCKTKDLDLIKIEKINITYAESNEDFANPERGFYRYSETSSSKYTILTHEELKSYRSPQSISGANYQVLSTLVFRYYVLDDIINTAISEAFLTNMGLDFEAARKAGVKLIPRFVYTTTANPGNCPEGFICPPYGDAPKAIILQHISQLKPILHDNADVIACVQLGFIGVWGEQYYSDFFGDASQNASQGKLLDNNWKDRIDIVRALLQSVPVDRMVQLRYPQLKQRYVYGIDAPVSSSALNESGAFNETDIARLGFHNDCFMANINDMGTYEDYGNSYTDRSSTASVQNLLKNYVEDDGKFVVVGGETCSDGYNPDNNCEPIGRIQAEFAAKHYSFINAHYNNDVNNDWQDGGCMDNIKRNLGYRFVLQTAILPDNAIQGTAMNVVLNIKNVGYASPYNKRPLKLLLRNIQTGAIESFIMSADIRKWYSGAVKVNENILIPKDLPTGDYEILIHLPDAYASISSRPEYAIRFANDDIWEGKTGYNKLNHIVKVN